MVLSVEELASRAGTSADAVRRFADLGILPSVGDGPFDESLVQRVRLVLQLVASGVSVDDIGAAIAAGRLSFAFAEVLFGRPVGMLNLSIRDLRSELSLSNEFLDGVWLALGATGSPDESIREDDAELLRLLDRFVRQGLDPLVAWQVTLRYFYVIAEAARKVAEGGREMWRKGVEEPMLARGLTASEYLEAIAAPGPESQRLVDPMLMVLFHRFLEAEIVASVMEHLEAALE